MSAAFFEVELDLIGSLLADGVEPGEADDVDHR